MRLVSKSAFVSTFAGLAIGFLIFTSPTIAANKLAPGNLNKEQPQIPGASTNRTSALNKTFDQKYAKVLKLLRDDTGLMSDIKTVAKQFKIDPIHMIGAIVGEHTYNVDAMDRAQSYYVKAMSYISSSIKFEFDGESVEKFVTRPEFEKCLDLESSFALWSCRENMWNAKFRGKKVGDKKFPNNRFSAVFFQPFYAGQTFGIGQLNPLTALMMTDKVHEVTGTRKISEADGKEVYATIMDPRKTLPYIAATLASSIDAYKEYAGFDISGNPGVTATLYNTGEAVARAKVLGAKNKIRKRAGLLPLPPEENYYGWLINEREDDLRALLKGGS